MAPVNGPLSRSGRLGRFIGGRPGVAGWAAAVLSAGLLAGPAAWARGTSAPPVHTPDGTVQAPKAPVQPPDGTVAPATEPPAHQRSAPPLHEALQPRGPWRWPLPAGSTLLAGFDPPQQRWLAGHRGVDLLAEAGAPVRAVANGVVAWVGVIAGVGSVAVQHPGGLRSTYQPVEATVTQGQRVAAGQTLGRLALPGSHCGLRACLHLGALVGRVYLDPALLLGDRAARLLPLPLPTVRQS